MSSPSSGKERYHNNNHSPDPIHIHEGMDWYDGDRVDKHPTSETCTGETDDAYPGLRERLNVHPGRSAILLQRPPESLTTATEPVPHDPFARLPTEVLAWIIYLTIIDTSKSPPSWPCTLETHLQLAEVCKTWSRCVYNTPSFWSKINGTEALERRLALSKSAPLDISVEYGGGVGESFEASLRRLFQEAHRWRWITVSDSREHAESLFSLIPTLSGILPLLERLSFSVNSAFSGQGMVTLCLSDTPRLRHLRLDRVLPIAIGPSIFCRLTHLHIGYMCAKVFNYQTLRAIIANAPLLEDVDLKLIMDNAEQAVPFSIADVPKIGQVILPNLRRLDLQDVHFPVVLPLLHCLVADSLSSLNFSALHQSRNDLYPSDYLWDDQALPRLAESVLRDPRDEVEIGTNGRGHFTINVGSGLSVAIGAVSHWSNTVQQVMRAFRLNGAPVILWLDSVVMASAEVVEAFALPSSTFNVSALNLSGNDLDGFKRTCELLSKPFGPSRVWMLDALEHLRFLEGDEARDEVQEVVKSLLRSRHNAEDDDSPKRIIVHFGPDMIFHEDKGCFLSQSLCHF